MAETLGIQFSIGAKIDELQKALNDAKKAIGDVAKESEKQADGIGDPLKRVADQVGERYGTMAGTIANKLASLVNPAAIASAAIAALGAAFVAYLESGQEKVKTLDEIIKGHTSLIKDIQKAYGDAAQGLKDYASESANVLGLRLAGSMAELQAQIKGLSQQITEPITRVLPALDELALRFGDVNAAGMTVKQGFEPFYAALERLRAGIESGNPDIRKFREEIAALVNQSGNTPELVAFGNKLIDVSKGAFEVEQKINQSKDAIAAMAGVAGSSITNLAEFEKALKAIASASPITKSPLQKLNEDLVSGLAAAGPDEKLIKQITDAYDKTRKEILDADAAAAAEKAAAEAERRAAELESEKQFLQMGLNNLTLSWGTREEQLAAHLTRQQELIQEARDKEVIDDQTHKSLMERSEQEHQNRIAQLRSMNNMTALKDLGTFFKGAEALAKSNGDKSFKTAKAFAIATGVLSTVSAAIQAMNDPTAITPFQKFANYAAVLGKGLSAVASIRGMSPSGGGGGGGSSGASGSSGGTPEGASSPSSRMGQSVFINLQGQSFGRDQVRDLVKQIADFQKDGGQVVFG